MNFLIECPKCGGTNLFGDDTVPGVSEIAGWSLENGELQPVYTGETRMAWDDQHPVDEETPWVCGDCDTKLSKTALLSAKHVVKSEEDCP